MKMKKKSDLPIKVCPQCNRPFSWRKKWEKNWQEIVYCSRACSSKKTKKRLSKSISHASAVQ